MRLLIQGNGWASGEDDHFVAEALYDFNAQSEDEVSFRQGQRINIAPKGKRFSCSKIHKATLSTTIANLL